MTPEKSPKIPFRSIFSESGVTVTVVSKRQTPYFNETEEQKGTHKYQRQKTSQSQTSK